MSPADLFPLIELLGRCRGAALPRGRVLDEEAERARVLVVAEEEGPVLALLGLGQLLVEGARGERSLEPLAAGGLALERRVEKGEEEVLVEIADATRVLALAGEGEEVADITGLLGRRRVEGVAVVVPRAAVGEQPSLRAARERPQPAHALAVVRRAVLIARHEEGGAA